jgi:hypothetical protein
MFPKLEVYLLKTPKFLHLVTYKKHFNSKLPLYIQYNSTYPELIQTARHMDIQKIRIIGFFFENRLYWQSEIRLLLFTACTCV